MQRTVSFAIAVVLLVGLPGTAFGFAGREHRAIGAESYTAACKRLEPEASRDPATAMRYEIACGQVAVQALLYGQANSVSGDFLGGPDLLHTATGSAPVGRRGNFFNLALNNEAHFQPRATREWRDHHTVALGRALAAAQRQGIEQVAAFEEAFYEAAFGDHFLQDSFAAGHMGFNRPASSAAASKGFHDQWNASGRWVANRQGQRWKTYGDGRLDRPESRDARAHVLAANTASVYSFLSTFVLGKRSADLDLQVWREVAFIIEDPELVPVLESLFGGTETLERPEFIPTLAVQRAAIKDGVLASSVVFASTFGDHTETSGAVLASGQLALPITIPSRIQLGVGVGFEDGFTEPRFAGDVGLLTGIGLTFDGLISHELDFGALFLFSDQLDAFLRLAYRFNVEAGDWLLRGEVGPTLNIDDDDFGVYYGVGLGYVLDVAGGGAFFWR